MSEELKPCPFCGCPDIRIEQTWKNGFTIECSKCHIKVEQKTIRYGLEWLKERMIVTWNTRPSQDLEKERGG